MSLSSRAVVNVVLILQEVNELLQKVSGSDKPVPIWSESTGRPVKSHTDHILYSFHFRLKVRLEL